MPWVWFFLGAALSGAILILVALFIRGRRSGRAGRIPPANVSLAELSRTVGGLAHEIKNPLSTISLNLNLLGEDLARYGDEEHRRLGRRLERVQHEADRLRQTLDDFLRYAGHCELTLSRVDLRGVVAELRDFFLPQAEASGAVLRTAQCDEPVFCMVDVNLLKQALLNLMINAAQAMESGGELLVKVSRQAGQAVIEVIDTGAGIEPDEMENIFQAYWSSKPAGSGLGLPTARRVVREHGGRITVESELGKGTRFVITLPLVQKK